MQLLFIFSFLFSIQLQAQIYSGGAISAGTGGAVRASSSPSEASILNPATLTEIHAYYFSSNYNQSTHPIDGDASTLALNLADGSEDKLFPGQFSYVRKKIDKTNGITQTYQDFQLGFAFAPYREFSFGLSFHRLLFGDNQANSYSQNNIHLGTLLTPIQDLSFAFVAYDILGGSDSVPIAYQTLPSFAFGTQYVYSPYFIVRLDLVRPDKANDGQKVNTMLGFETYFRPDFVFRAGYQWREVGYEQKIMSFGLGYKGPRLSLDYSFQQDSLLSSSASHFIDLWLPF